MGLIETTLNYTLNRLYNFISYINLGDTINYYAKDYENNCISTIYGRDNRLYGLCLKVSSNLEKKFKMPSVEKDGKILVSIVRNDKNICNIYVFSEDIRTMTAIADRFNIKLLNPDELISALYSIFLIDTFKIEDKQIKNIFTTEENPHIDYDPLHIIFPQMIKNATINLLKTYIPYQAVSFQRSENYSIFDLLSLDWQGVLFFLIEFSENEVEKYLSSCKSNAKLMDSNYTKKFREMYKQENVEALRELYKDTAIVNSIAFVRNHIDINKIENEIKVKYEPRYLSMDKIASKTLLRARDRDFDFLVPREWATQLISTTIQEDALFYLKDRTDIHKKVDFAGLDIQDNFVNYTFKQSINPHALVLGTTGIGKSVSVLKMMAQIIDFDFEKKCASNLNEHRKIRYLNVGFCGGRIFEAIQLQAIKEEKNLMQKMDSNIGDLRFSLFDFDGDYPSEDEIKALIAFINLMLNFERASNSNKFTDLEETIFKECVMKACEEKKRIPTSITVKELKANHYNDYKNFIDDILREKDENGNPLYSEMTTLGKLSDKYKRFKRPVLRDVISILERITNETIRTDGERQAISTVKDKLGLLVINKIYSLYSNIDLKDNIPLYYAEFDRIKNHKKDFVAIAWLLTTCWFKVDKEIALQYMNRNEPKPDSYYFIDEAHNFLSHAVFKELLEIYAREMRKYGCHLFLITQSALDIDEKVANFFATKFFIFTDENKEVTYDELKYLNGNKDISPTDKKIFDKIDNAPNKNRVIYMKHNPGGTTALKLPELKQYSHFFTSYDF